MNAVHFSVPVREYSIKLARSQWIIAFKDFLRYY